MSLLARHRYMLSRIAEAFEYHDEDDVEVMMLEPECLSLIDYFFTLDGPTKIVLTLEDKFSINSKDGKGVTTSTAKDATLKEKGEVVVGKRLKVHVRDVDTLPKTAVYFVKPKRGKDNDDHYAIDPAKINDGLLSFGIIRAPLESMEAIVRCVYRPLIQDMDKTWGEATGEQKNEFMQSLDAFTRGLQDNIRSLSGGLEFKNPDERLETLGANASSDPVLVMKTTNMMQEWCMNVEHYIDDHDRSRWETVDSGPDTELNYWKSRMQRLLGITEQLKGKIVKNVLVLLNTVARTPAVDLDPLIDVNRVQSILAQWREIDLQITEAAAEAKDNVKYLSTLERFFEPLFGTEPSSITDSLPGLLNAVKMIHTISRHFGTNERVTKLLMKISNQMITCCKLSLNSKDLPDKIWDKDLPKLLEQIEKCLQLNEEYQNQYRLIKEKLMQTPKGKQFDFSESQVFGKIDLFCRRLIKLMDMFSTMDQFYSLVHHKFDGIDPLIRSFNEIIKSFRGRGHDLLDFLNSRFDKDYVDFNSKMNELESQLQKFINRSFENMSSIESSLTLLKRYQSILHREHLRNDLDSKLSVIFHNYGLELIRIEQIYEKFKDAPPIARNMPPVAGNIAWARHLLRKIEEPMKKFQGHAAVLGTKESKKIIKTYNKVAKTLVAFEYLWFEAWTASIEAAKAGLQATLVIRHPDSGKLYVNFDQELFQLIREAKCMVKLEVSIPESAQIVLLQEEKYKSYYDDLKYMLSEYERITSMVIPVTDKLIEPHLKTMELKLRPGMVTLTWTSMNIDAYKLHIQNGLQRLEELVTKVNDIVENRIQKNLKNISRMVLVSLPNERSVALDEFVVMQETAVKACTQLLVVKNLEVENSVLDLFAVLAATAIDPSVDPVTEGDLQEVREHFNTMTYQALLNCVRVSLTMIKKRACARIGAGVLFKQEPFFEVDVQLSVPSVRLSPSLDDIQRAINRASVAVISCGKKMWLWGQAGVPDREKKTFYDILGKDIEIVKTILLLTGAMHGTRKIVTEYLNNFRKYDWLWKDDKEQTYKKFMAQFHSGPSIENFENELRYFMTLENEIASIVPNHFIGALNLNTANLKLQLWTESRLWKLLYSSKVHSLARESMHNLYEYIRVVSNRLNADVVSLDSLRFVMNVLKEIREKESSIAMDITPVLDMYTMLENYLPDGVIEKEEKERKLNLYATWKKLIERSDEVQNGLSAVQGVYKKQLIWDIREFTSDIRTFRKDFEEFGPMTPGIKPNIAIEKLKKYKEELIVRERKLDAYRAGEELFALRTTRFNEVLKTRKDVNLIDTLYSLYTDVFTNVKSWQTSLWVDVGDYVGSMIDLSNGFDSRLKKLSKKVREWAAFEEVSTKVAELQVAVPLLGELTKVSVKPRHWEEVNTLVMSAGAKKLPYEEANFCLQHVLDAGIHKHREHIEDICDSADKQLQIERKITELKDRWNLFAFEFFMWKNRDIAVLKSFGYVIEELEDTLMQLQTLLSIRHVAPFREDVQKFLTLLSDTADTLEMWVKVQMLWTSLESVFLGGDIAKQMPVEAKKFSKINKDWEKLMARAFDTKLVVHCCANELLKTTLPALYSELEKCQKSLEGYLEQKRSKFPRFYFVSNPVLLLILSQGSDPTQMQPYYEKVFDSIERVTHSKSDKNLITEILSMMGPTKETIALSKSVKASGNIEDWLCELELEMQKSLKNLCQVCAAECLSIPLRQLVNKNCGQFALLAIQILWTSQCVEALNKAKSNKQIISETNRQQLSVLQDLSSWCLEDLGSKMNRVKIETLITIQVHQRDVFADLAKLFKERKLTDASDFEWLKQTRFSWHAGVPDKHGVGACIISICDVDYHYNYEYLGCKERLVITPLTDRCFITLSQAMGMCLGGAPAGPAGTGKTETVKDLGRAIGAFVVVTNCTDQQRFTDMARLFKGLCQAGIWGCFDEFNRIELPVLSVVAQQVLAITNAKRTKATSFTFPGDSSAITINRNVGYFITMNPGYAGRQELPENLKALFRGVVMMVPDREIIIKVKLCSVGYQFFTELARKFTVLYALCEQQLSKQKHYDFGLRNILSVLRTAGQIKRNRISDPEESLLMSTLRDMNLSKMVAQDVPLFLSLLSDLFPNLGLTAGQPHTELKAALAQVVEHDKLILHPSWTVKVVQLYETTLVRHGVMVVGPSGAGKSKIIGCLQETLTQTTSIVHKRCRMNPKAIRPEEMFGETDKMTGEWVDGVFASMWAKFNDRNRKDNQWIICDGPVDAVWIENLNTVLDDNKILTLANGDRIPMTDNVKLLFEVEDLRNASPATVSRAGIIYVSESDLDWEPFLRSWLNQLKTPLLTQLFTTYFEKYVGKCEGPKSYGHLFHFVQKNCKPVIYNTRIGIIEGCCNLLNSLLAVADLSPNLNQVTAEIERLFIFCLIWSVGGVLEHDDRGRLAAYIQDLCNGPAKLPVGKDGKVDKAAKPVVTWSESLPKLNGENDSFYEYRVNPDSMEWEKWLVPYWEFPQNIAEPDFSSMLVPTVETTRACYLLKYLHTINKGVLMTGTSGTAKTSTAYMFFDSIQNETMKVKKFCFSSTTSPFTFQSTIEGELDKRGGKSFGPPSGRKLTVFLDDLSMPEKNNWGDQPTLEFVRQMVETQGFCFLDKDKRGDIKLLEDMQYIAAMGQPGPGKQDIPNRLKRHFFIFNLVVPSLSSINEIYGQLMTGRYTGVPPMFKQLIDQSPTSTVNLWSWIRGKMLPTPSKFHYSFSLRDISRVFQGILRTPKQSVITGKAFVQLWRHECTRVFSDKLTNDEDKDAFAVQLDSITEEMLSLSDKIPVVAQSTKAPAAKFGAKKKKDEKEVKEDPKAAAAAAAAPKIIDAKLTFADVVADEPFFVDFLRDDKYDEDGLLVEEAPKIYELGGKLDDVRVRVSKFLRKFNEQYPAKNLNNLVLFDDAMRHLIRISRILGMPKGCILLVGVGGSGKQSLTRLAAYCAGQSFFQITISKSYNLNSLMDDVRSIYKSCGQKGEKVTFLLTEAEIKDESFLEVFNSILTTGEVANLFPKDELAVMASELRGQAIKQNPNFVDTPDNLVKFFFDRVRRNLHVVLCMSPVSAKFPERARKFPGITAGCTIDWFLPWPKEALLAVSSAYMKKMTLDCKPEVANELIVHMGLVHKIVVDFCEEYFVKMRRHVYQTPKSFLLFLADYATMYKTKCADIKTLSSRVDIGLEKLKAGAADVEKMKVLLAIEEVKLKESEDAANHMLGKLETSSMEAKKEADLVSRVKAACQADADRIAGEKAEAELDLAKAQPFVDEAERAVGSIRPNDLNELKKLGKPADIIKLIFDCVSILKMSALEKYETAEITLGIGKDKRTFQFIKDSYKKVQSGVLSDTNFLKNILQFSRIEKDFINDETIELLSPYMELDGFRPDVARNASKAAEGLCTWCRAMSDYVGASKIVKPKLEALKVAEGKLQEAERELFKAEARLRSCQDFLGSLQESFDRQINIKRTIEENTAITRKRMEQATSLIEGLASERLRWTQDKQEFVAKKQRLVGDVALACAFVSYCGAFNQEYRERLIHKILSEDLRSRKIPMSTSLDLTNFLADESTLGDWAIEGLPSDPLSIQNGILVTRSSRFPLLIDPQGQASNWITKHESTKMPTFGAITMAHPKFRENFEYCLSEGKALIVTGIENELDPLIYPVLEKQITYKAKSKYIMFAGKHCDFNEDFMFYLVTRLPNPHFSPEDQSKCTVVDFTVTQKGLEEQLLGRVIQKEQRSLEESLKNVLEEVNNNTKSLVKLDISLLERLSENTGNLLDDEELISVLAETKAKAVDVREKLNAAADMKRSINEKREQFRPVATRGSVLYFSIVDMSGVNSMYQTSLDQFQLLFDKSMDVSEKVGMAIKRITNIIDSLTYLVYRYINRGLFERDKATFKLISAFKILSVGGKLDAKQFNVFLKGGGGLDPTSCKAKPFNWITQEAWLNCASLTQAHPAYKTLLEDIIGNETLFSSWYNEVEPERLPVPIIEARFSGDEESISNFNRLLLVRCLREDRTLLAVNEFVRKTDNIEGPTFKLPVLGPKYTEPVADTVESVLKEMEYFIPAIYLLSAGADPTDSIEALSRKRRKEIDCISMGEGQEAVAMRAITAAVTVGSWVLLQNCHLGLQFIDTLEDLILKLKLPDSNCHPDFRLFLTTEPHPKFSIGLLQMSIKVTNEPPKGLRAGLHRSYTIIVDQEKLERNESPNWRILLYTFCFLHSCVQERRKFGPLGWCVPYEFNDGDLKATITFLEKHLETSVLNWTTLQYMAGEVQYGGRITDDIDRRLFMAYTEAWLSNSTLSSSFTFNSDRVVGGRGADSFAYKCHNYGELESYLQSIGKLPDVDSPEIFGLHPNADFTFRFKEVNALLETVVETQPKQSAGSESGGKTREEIVLAKCEELMKQAPANYIEDEYDERITAQGGYDVPLNIFLFQEVQRQDAVISKCKFSFSVIIQAIRGEVVATAEIMDSINAIFDARVPRNWLYNPAGDELSWLSPNLGAWYGSLLQRDVQYKTWLSKGRPDSYWITGFFNGQGFITAVQQEITRMHKSENWSLDSVSLHSEVTDMSNADNVSKAPKEGVYVHGLSLEGASWNASEMSLVESAPRKLFATMPIIVITAVAKAAKAKLLERSDYGPFGGYECPVYKYPLRSDRYRIFMISLPSKDTKPLHWVLRGVALLCSTS